MESIPKKSDFFLALCYNKVFLISCEQCPPKFFMNCILQFHFQTCLYFAVCEGITDATSSPLSCLVGENLNAHTLC
jgi:hypothetical protein